MGFACIDCIGLNCAYGSKHELKTEEHAEQGEVVILFSLLAGTFQVVSTNQTVAMHPSSVLCAKSPSLVVFNEIVWTTKQYMMTVAAVESQWLQQAGAHFYK